MANPNPPAPPNNTGKVYQTLKPASARVFMFKQFFLDPTSQTFWNVRGSAIKAGYSEQYANNITVQNPKWWLDLKESSEYRRAKMLNQAEKNIDKTLTFEETDSDTKLKLKHDASKFVSERLGKDHYSTRKELTDKGGKRLFTNSHSSESRDSIDDLFVNVGENDEQTAE